MDLIDYIGCKVFNMRVQNDKTYPRYTDPDTKYVDTITLASGFTDATRSNHTLTGEVNPSPSREVLIKVATIGRDPSINNLYYPTSVRLGLTVDDIEDSDLDYFDDAYYSQFIWFNMEPISNTEFGLYLNERFSKYLKAGIKYNIKFIYRVFDNQGNEYKYLNPHYQDNTKHSYWDFNAYKVSMSKYTVPNDIDVMVDGINTYNGDSDVDTCRTFTVNVGSQSITVEDTTKLGKTEQNSPLKWTHSGNVNVVDQFETINIIADLTDYWQDEFDYCKVKVYFTLPDGTEKSLYVKPQYNRPFKYNLSFKLSDFAEDDMFKIGMANHTVNFSFGITAFRHNAEQPEYIVPGYLTLLLVDLPDDMDEFTPEDISVIERKLAEY